MNSSSSLFVSVLVTVAVILSLITATTTASIAPFDNLLIANAQESSQPNIAQPVTQQEEESALILQGTVTSSQDPLPGHEEHQMATVLPFREDGALHSGILTYTATEPVEIVILNMQTLNETEQAILNATDDGEFGTLFTTQLDNQTSLSTSYITPPYAGSPVPSASIPFVGNAVWLHTLSGEPFSATFVVNAQVLPSETQNNINTDEEITDIVSPEDDEEEAEETEDADVGNDIVSPEDDEEEAEETEDADVGNDTAEDVEAATEEEAEETEDATATTAATTTTTDDDSMASTAANNNGEEADNGGNNEVAIVRIPQGSSSFTDDAYSPNPVEVNIGDTVTWINDDFTSHTATSGTADSGSTGMFGGTDDSPEIIGPEGDTQSFTFDEAGEFEYYCTLHPSMVGTVVVTEG